MLGAPKANGDRQSWTQRPFAKHWCSKAKRLFWNCICISGDPGQGFGEERSGKSGFWLGLLAPCIDALKPEAADHCAGRLSVFDGSRE